MSAVFSLNVARLSVPRMLRNAPPFAAWCAADPGPMSTP